MCLQKTVRKKIAYVRHILSRTLFQILNGKWYFRSWCDSGVLENILQSLVDDCRNFYLVEIDSTFCKAHQHATGARKILGNQNIGVSRGGKTTKIHALVNEHFQLIGVELFTTVKWRLNFWAKSLLKEKKFWLTKPFVPKRFAILFLKKKPLPVFPTNPSRLWQRTL